MDGTYVGSTPRFVHVLQEVKTWTANNRAPLADTFPTGLTQISSASDDLARNAFETLFTVDSSWRALGDTTVFPRVGVVVHYGTGVADAATTINLVNGVRWLIFGDGGSMFGRPTAPLGNVLDVVAHEYGHARTRTVSGFSRTTLEAGTVDEAYADISAIVVQLLGAGGNPSEATWTIADGLFPSAPSLGIRSASTPAIVGPGSQTAEATLDFYPQMQRSPLSSHENSTIITHAYKLLVTGGQHSRAGIGPIPTTSVPPLGQDLTRRIFDAALRLPELRVTPTLFSLRAATEAAAALVSEATRLAVRTAWDVVGLGFSCATPPGAPTLTVQSLFCKGEHFSRWTAVPGATHYYGEVIPASASGQGEAAWSLAAPIADDNILKCDREVPFAALMRVRACNGCGCGAPSSPKLIQYFATGL